MVILTFNCGSSSAKYQVFNWEKKQILASGAVERVTTDKSFIEHKVKGREEYVEKHPCPDHEIAIELIIKTLLNPDHGVLSDIKEIGAVGHRVVHGGDKFAKSVIVTEDILNAFRDIQDLSPLHNPANIMGIEAAQKVLPAVPHCAIMDTAWHQTMPPVAFMYALPYKWYEKYNVRRYGFHGTSYIYTAKRASVLLGKDPLKTNLIIAHIGNGASICAVKNGTGFDTSMGLTPLEGLIMGTRCGDIDPAIIPYMIKQTEQSAEELDLIMNKKSGLLGITEKYIDRRDIQDKVDKGDKRAILAQDMEAYRIKKYIGSYYAALGRVDAIVFTAGVGEMNPQIREKILEGLEDLGIKLDLEKNSISKCRNGETLISADNSKIKIFVIPTDEELVMTEDTHALVQNTYDIHTNFKYTFQEKNYKNLDRAERLKKDIESRPGLDKIIAKVEL